MAIFSLFLLTLFTLRKQKILWLFSVQALKLRRTHCQIFTCSIAAQSANEIQVSKVLSNGKNENLT